MLISWLPRYHEADPGTPSGGTSEAPVSLPPAASEIPADDFDKDRAMATIKNLREFEKAAKAQLKELEALKAEKQQRDEAELSAAERAEKKAAELEAKYQAAQAQLKRATLKDAASDAAGKANLTFAPGALSDALALGLFDGLEGSDDDKPKGMSTAIKDLAATKPYLFQQAPKAGDIDAGAKNTGNPTKSTLERNRNAWGITVRE